MTTEIAEALVTFPLAGANMGQTFTDKLFLGSVATKPAISSVVGVPVAAGNAGDLALSDNGTLYVYDGVAWVATQDALPALANGEIYIGSAGLPVAASITSGGGISATGAAGAIVLGSTAGGDLSGSVAVAEVVGLRNTPVSATAPALNEVLKYNGAAWAPAADVAGSIGGTIAATQIAFGTALDTIGGSAKLTWDDVLTDALAISDALTWLTTPATPGALELDDTTTGNRLVFTIAAGQATITSAFSGGGAQPLTLNTSDLKLAGLSGSPGDVLTVGLLGAPEWQAPAAAGIDQLTGDVTAGPGSGSQAATLSTQGINTANNLGLTSLGGVAPTANQLRDVPAFRCDGAFVGSAFTLLAPTGAQDGRQVTFINATGNALDVNNIGSLSSRTMSPSGGSTWVYSAADVNWYCTSWV